ncbi:hypothetical protein GCM10009813_22980 [Brevibacterium marinum]
MVDADRLTDRTDAQRPPGLSEGDEQSQLRPSAEVTASEVASPIVFVVMSTTIAVMTAIAAGCVLSEWTARVVRGTFIFAAVSAPTAPERKISPSWTAESGTATETRCA